MKHLLSDLAAIGPVSDEEIQIKIVTYNEGLGILLACDEWMHPCLLWSPPLKRVQV